MFLRFVLLSIFIVFHPHLYAQTPHETTIDLLGNELAQQALARGVSRVAIFDFTEGNSTTDFSKAISEELRIQMAVRNVSLTLVDRASTERVIEEQRLSAQPLFNETQAATLGKLVSADAIITGVIISLRGESRITAKMVSVETGAIIGGHTVNLKRWDFNESESQAAYELPTNAAPPKRLSFHAEANAGFLFVNQTVAPSVGFSFSRLTYRGELHESRLTKGKKGFTGGVNYHVGLPVQPTHANLIGFRTQDGYGNGVKLNGVDIGQDSYFMMIPNTAVQCSIPDNIAQTPTFILFTCDRIRVDRLRVDFGWRHTLFESSVRVYAETGLAWVKQFDRSTYSSATFSAQHESILSYQFNGNIAPAELPNLWEVKAAVGVERGRWGVHVEGAVTTRNRDYMSPLDMFHHPDLTSWSSVQTDLKSKGVAEITSQSASENWYYWFSSIVQLRYQL